MKFNNVLKREFSAVGVNMAYSDYIGSGITTKDVTMDTGYRGRGLKTMYHDFCSGTLVEFTLKEYRSPSPHDVYTELEISAIFEADSYKVSHRIMEPIDVAANILGIDDIARISRV